MMLFVCTLAPNSGLQVQARETTPSSSKMGSILMTPAVSNEKPVANLSDSEYAPVQGEPVPGDLVNLVNDRREVVHTAVYIGDGFVCAKNGVQAAQPWSVMKLTEMQALYQSEGRVVYLRRAK